MILVWFRGTCGFNYNLYFPHPYRAELPAHVVTMLNNMPNKLHPMSQFSAAVTALNSESTFVKAYSEGVHKSKYWEVSRDRVYYRRLQFMA